MFLVFSVNFRVLKHKLLAVSRGPAWFRELLEACRNDFHLMSCHVDYQPVVGAGHGAWGKAQDQARRRPCWPPSASSSQGVEVAFDCRHTPHINTAPAPDTAQGCKRFVCVTTPGEEEMED